MIDARVSITRCNPVLGLQIVESLHATEHAEDWSRVRSPSRATRRLKQGHRQNIRQYRKPTAYQIGNDIYMHPDLVSALRDQLSASIDAEYSAAMQVSCQQREKRSEVYE